MSEKRALRVIGLLVCIAFATWMVAAVYAERPYTGFAQIIIGTGNAVVLAGLLYIGLKGNPKAPQ